MSPDEEASPERKPDEPESPAPSDAAKATPKKSRGRPRKMKSPPVEPPKEKEEEEEKEGPRAPRRPTLDAERVRLLRLRREADLRRPRFVRTAAYRYYRIGRYGSWRRPDGIQSKQRRHYGYRSRIVRIGYRSPARVRGLLPTGFVPVLVHTAEELAAVDVKTEAAILARTLGTRMRLILEETARKRGVKILNPLEKERREE